MTPPVRKEEHRGLKEEPKDRKDRTSRKPLLVETGLPNWGRMGGKRDGKKKPRRKGPWHSSGGTIEEKGPEKLNGKPGRVTTNFVWASEGRHLNHHDTVRAIKPTEGVIKKKRRALDLTTHGRQEKRKKGRGAGEGRMKNFLRVKHGTEGKRH